MCQALPLACADQHAAGSEPTNSDATLSPSASAMRRSEAIDGFATPRSTWETRASARPCRGRDLAQGDAVTPTELAQPFSEVVRGVCAGHRSPFFRFEGRPDSSGADTT